MQKISANKLAEVLHDTQRVLISVTQERDKLAYENASIKRTIEAEKLASVMHDKGCRLDTNFSDLVTELEKAAEEGQLPVIQQAVDMVGPNMGFRGIQTHDEMSGGGNDSLTSYLIGGVG